MLIYVKQSFCIKNKDGQKWSAHNQDITTPPDWVVNDSYFKSLCDSGKITVHIDSKSIEVEQSNESKNNKRRAQ